MRTRNDLEANQASEVAGTDQRSTAATEATAMTAAEETTATIAAAEATVAQAAGCTFFHLLGVPVDTQIKTTVATSVAKQNGRSRKQGDGKIRKNGSWIRYLGNGVRKVILLNTINNRWSF